MNVVFVAVYGLLAISAFVVMVRLLRGPGALDRIIAVDLLVVLLVAGVAVATAMEGHGAYVPLLVAVALLGFVGSASAARLATIQEL
ncbi:hypothetical protein GCM10012275_22010 [Longimycelium tulufanense]|uniref:Sodium:proton antiporter n=1 Tax=Longimycelium tulufanense TaxID=907463 RepID=A0A8J3FVC9_9PSEU|nr:monovalent cation/H+ antiporter complex subunit F [Longimycelium tulufanense]GGM50756.1 hypothetical protein GCM10012275_22010 [Longimycelium tulufanense]